MRFLELSKEKQIIEIKDYIKGWKETHEEETLSYDIARMCLIDIGEVEK